MRSAAIVTWLSGIVVVGFCLFLIGLAVVIAARPALAERFLRSFASSARAHYTEQGLRLLVAVAVVTFANSMRHPELFKLFGWLMVVSTVGLLLTPWQWHHKFSLKVMPPVYRHLRLFGLAALALAALILYGVSAVVA